MANGVEIRNLEYVIDGIKFLTNVLVMFLILFLMTLISFHYFDSINYVFIIIFLIVFEMGYLFTRYKHHFVGLFSALSILISIILLVLKTNLLTVILLILPLLLGIYNFHQDILGRQAPKPKSESSNKRDIGYIEIIDDEKTKRKTLNDIERRFAERRVVGNPVRRIQADQSFVDTDKIIVNKTTNLAHHPECPMAAKITSNNMAVIKKNSLLYKAMKKHTCLTGKRR